jgi:glycogen operon protein
VNFITAHDGFTLRDVVSYNDKHNDANGEDGRDGTGSNYSWNYGVEGETDDAEVNETRRRHMRNMLATLLLSQGTPMILAGDEFGRTQGGNNNAYCQDNEISWFDWNLPEWAKTQVALVQRLTRLRHDYPILRRGRFFTGTPIDALDVKDVTWINASGAEMEAGDWHDPGMKCFGMLIDGRAQATGIRKPGHDTTMLIVLNAHHDLVTFTLPECTNGKAWELVFDTNVPDRDDRQSFAIGDTYAVTGGSLLLFALHS